MYRVWTTCNILGVKAEQFRGVSHQTDIAFISDTIFRCINCDYMTFYRTDVNIGRQFFKLELGAIICIQGVNLPAPNSLAPDNGQPYRLSLLHALASASDDPDIKLLPLLSEGVPTGALSELPRSMQWPLKEHADLPHELTECMGNWKATEAEPTQCLPFWIKKSHTPLIQWCYSRNIHLPSRFIEKINRTEETPDSLLDRFRWRASRKAIAEASHW